MSNKAELQEKLTMLREQMAILEREIDALKDKPEQEYACVIPVNPNAAMGELPLNAVKIENNGLLAVQCDADGWIDWPGRSHRPVRLDALVDIELRDGDVIRNHPASHIDWRVYGTGADVARFRVNGAAVIATQEMHDD